MPPPGVPPLEPPLLPPLEPPLEPPLLPPLEPPLLEPEPEPVPLPPLGVVAPFSGSLVPGCPLFVVSEADVPSVISVSPSCSGEEPVLPLPWPKSVVL